MSSNWYWVREYTIFTNHIVDSYGQVGNQRHIVHSIGLKDKRSDCQMSIDPKSTIGDLKKRLVRNSEWYKLLQPYQLNIYNKHENIEFPDHMTIEEAYKEADYAFHVK
jgi:hypothetical protein